MAWQCMMLQLQAPSSIACSIAMLNCTCCIRKAHEIPRGWRGGSCEGDYPRAPSYRTFLDEYRGQD